MEYKTRKDVDRLVNDRQAYISSLELKLEKFTQGTQSYLDLKEKMERLSLAFATVEEKIQGLNWTLKQQSENQQLQFKNLSTKYEELQQQITYSQSFAETKIIKNDKREYKITKEIEDLIGLHMDQIKGEFEQRIEIISSKNALVSKNIGGYVDSLKLSEERVRTELAKEFEKTIDKSKESIRNFECRLEKVIEVQNERYKELSMKIKSASGMEISESLSQIRQSFSKLEEYKKKFEENELRRELEVKEASQASWNVESQLKTFEKDFTVFRNILGDDVVGKLDAYEREIICVKKYLEDDVAKKSEMCDTGNKVKYLTTAIKKYLAVQKDLHKKVEGMWEKNERTMKKSPKLLRKKSGLNRSKQNITKDEISSPHFKSPKSSSAKRTPRLRSAKPLSNYKNNIDILYDELSNLI